MGKQTQNPESIEYINNQFENTKNEFAKIEGEYRRISLLDRSEWLYSDYYFMTKYHQEGTSHEADKAHIEVIYSTDPNYEGVKYTETLGKEPNYYLALDTAEEALKDLILLNDDQKTPFIELVNTAKAAIKKNNDAKSIEDDKNKYGKAVKKITNGYNEYSNYLCNKIEALAPDNVMYDKATENEPRKARIIANNENTELEKLCAKYNSNQSLLHTLSAEHKNSTTPNLDRLKAYSLKHYGPEGDAIKQDRNWGGWKYFDLAATLLTVITLPFRLYKDGLNFFKAEGAKKMDKAEDLLKEKGIEPPPELK